MQIRNKQTSLTLDVPTQRKPRDCPVEEWLTFLGHRWNALLLWHLATSPKRHAELLTLLPGISAKVLAERLSALAQRGLIKKSPLATFPRTVSYALSEQGAEIVNILNLIEVWTKTISPNPTLEWNAKLCAWPHSESPAIYSSSKITIDTEKEMDM